MQTINFCGDSFCQKESDNNYSLSWTTLLANKLNASIIGWGGSGSAPEHAIQTFDDTVDYTVFCWTDPNRLYVNPDYSANMNNQRRRFFHQLGGLHNNIAKAAYAYYKYLHNIPIAEQRFKRELYWFDHVILSNYRGVAVHLSCFNVQHVFTHGINIDTPLYAMRSKDVKNELSNHFTEQENFELADKLYSIIKERS